MGTIRAHTVYGTIRAHTVYGTIRAHASAWCLLTGVTGPLGVGRALLYLLKHQTGLFCIIIMSAILGIVNTDIIFIIVINKEMNSGIYRFRSHSNCVICSSGMYQTLCQNVGGSSIYNVH